MRFVRVSKEFRNAPGGGGGLDLVGSPPLGVSSRRKELGIRRALGSDGVRMRTAVLKEE
jgi:hypothetical protein